MLVRIRNKKRSKARGKKHPVFAENRFQAISIIGEEFGELAQAVNDNDFEQAEAEALDLIATCIRFLKNKNKLKE